MSLRSALSPPSMAMKSCSDSCHATLIGFNELMAILIRRSVLSASMENSPDPPMSANLPKDTFTSLPRMRAISSRISCSSILPGRPRLGFIVDRRSVSAVPLDEPSMFFVRTRPALAAPLVSRDQNTSDVPSTNLANPAARSNNSRLVRTPTPPTIFKMGSPVFAHFCSDTSAAPRFNNSRAPAPSWRGVPTKTSPSPYTVAE